MIQYLRRDTAPDLAYRKLESTETGKKLPIIVFLGGFRSDMEGRKATFIEEQCKKRGQGYVRFDYRGHGVSQGKFEDACISDWTQDAVDILDHCTSGAVILIGSSMGGWIALLTALKRPERLHSLIGLAAAPDFTMWIEKELTDEQKQALETDGFFELPNDYDDTPYIINKRLFDDGRNNALLHDKIDISAPVRLIQGKLDSDVPWQTTDAITKQLTSDNVKTILLEDADHRLSTDEQLQTINQTIEELLEL